MKKKKKKKKKKKNADTVASVKVYQFPYVICGRCRPGLVCVSAQSEKGLRFPIAELRTTVDEIDEQRMRECRAACWGFHTIEIRALFAHRSSIMSEKTFFVHLQILYNSQDS